ncbi:MAG: hypothetical protein ACRCTA_01450 [Bacilli bacterium]
MINTKNKSLAFILYLITAVLSWLVFLSSFIIQLATLFQDSISNINLFSFLFATILLTIYTLIIMFKLRAGAFFPLIILCLHLLSLEGSILLPVYVIIDIVVLILLNTREKNNPSTSKYSYYQEDHLTSDNSDVIDAEYTEH